MLQYDWIKIIATIVLAIIVWELIFTVAGVRLTAGQNFKIYYYHTLSTGGADDLDDFIDEKVDFSYDIITRGAENLMEDYATTVLEARLSVAEGDIMFTDNIIYPFGNTEDSEYENKKEDSRYNKSNMYMLADNYNMYDYQTLAKDAREYLDSFKENGELSDTLIESNFKKRMKKDNRFRKSADFKAGLVDEIARIERLEQEVTAFEWLLDTYKQTELFFNYTRYQYTYLYNCVEEYKEAYESQELKPYGINAGFLDKEEIRGERKSIADIMCLNSGDNQGKAVDVAIMVFDFRNKQADLQYETIVFINAIIYNYSTLYDGTQFADLWKN